MSRVLIRIQSWGTVTDRAGNALASLTMTIKNTDTTAATHWSAETGGTSSTANLVTDANGGATLSGADRWIEAGEYDVTVNGTTYRVNSSGIPSSVITVGAPRFTSVILTPSGSDDSVPFAAALTAIAGNGEIILGPGTFLWNTSIPALAASATQITVRGAGRGATVIQLSTGAIAFLTFNRTADYQTFQNIEVSDLTVDCNQVGGVTHTVIGSTGTTAQQRINLNNITVQRINVINGLSDANTATNHRGGITLGSFHPGVNEGTQTSITNILIEDFTMDCGNAGAVVNGGSPPGGANILVDNVKMNRCEHMIPIPRTTAPVTLSGTFTIPVTSTAGWAPSGHLQANNSVGSTVAVAYTGTTSTSFTGCTVISGTGTLISGAGVGYPTTSNFQVGSRAIGGRCVLQNMKGGGSGDNSLEMNALTNALIDNYECIDDLNYAFVQINYQTPQYPNAQRIVYRNCTFRRTDPASNGGAFLPGVSTSIADLISVVFDRCKMYVDTDGVYNGSGQAINCASSGSPSNIHRISVSGFEVHHIASNPSLSQSNTINWFLMTSASTEATLSMRDIDIVVSGSITNNGNGASTRLIDINGTDLLYTLDDIRFDFNVSGLPGNSGQLLTFATAASVVRGNVSRLVCRQVVGAVQCAVRIVSANLTFDAEHVLTFTDCDFGQITNGVEVLHDTPATSCPFTHFKGRHTWKAGVSSSLSVVTATNASWPIPLEAIYGAALMRITAIGGHGAGGGGGSAAAAQLQVGGAGGVAATYTTQVVQNVGANTTLNVTIGNGATGGGGGSAGGNLGTAGAGAQDTTVTGTGISIKGKGGPSGAGSAASSTTAVSAVAAYGSNTRQLGDSQGGPGLGGASGAAGGDPLGFSPGGGGGGGPATATLGGGGGNPGTMTGAGTQGTSGASGTAAGVVGVAGGAWGTTTYGPGGGGGGGAAGTGAGGNGGNGSKGVVIVELLN